MPPRRIVPVIVVDPQEIKKIKSAGKKKDPFEKIYKKYGQKDTRLKELSESQVKSIEKELAKRDIERKPKKSKKEKIPSLIKKLEKNRKKQEKIMEQIYEKYEKKDKRKSPKKKKKKSKSKKRVYRKAVYSNDSSCRNRKQHPKKYLCTATTKKGTRCTCCTDDKRKLCKMHL